MYEIAIVIQIFSESEYVSLASRKDLALTLFVCSTHCASNFLNLLRAEVLSEILPLGGKIGFGVQRRRCFRPVTFTEKMSSFMVKGAGLTAPNIFYIFRLTVLNAKENQCPIFRSAMKQTRSNASQKLVIILRFLRKSMRQEAL